MTVIDYGVGKLAGVDLWQFKKADENQKIVLLLY